MNKIDILKMGTGMVSRAAMHHIVLSAINLNVPRKNLLERALTVSGGLVLSSLLGDIAKNHVDNKIDTAVEWYHQNVIK